MTVHATDERQRRCDEIYAADRAEDANHAGATRLVTAALPSGRYDSGSRRQAQRRGRERGCWLYVPAEELLKAGVDPYGPPPLYRVWGSRRGGLFARFYTERHQETRPPREGD